MQRADTFNLIHRLAWLRAGLKDLPDSRAFCGSGADALYDSFFENWTREAAEIECELATRA